ncbi:hypothetical protein U1Q18_008747 [Sarracenia purpurea var. burkii]
MAEKVTTMVLKVDLQCRRCYRKVKKALCKFPQIRNQIYDEKQNTVTITVVCCNPEKLRDKLCYKGAKAIKSIEIKEQEKSKPPPEKKEPEKSKPNPPPKKEPEKSKPPPEKKEAENPPSKKVEPEKSKESEKPKPNPPSEKKEPEKSKPPPEKKETKKPEPNPPPEKKETKKPEPNPPPEKSKPPPENPPMEELSKATLSVEPAVMGWCPPAYPVYCGQCYHGQPGVPVHNGYESRPLLCHDDGGYGYGYGYGHGHGGHKSCYTSRCDDYFTEENTSGCTIV